MRARKGMRWRKGQGLELGENDKSGRGNWRKHDCGGAVNVQAGDPTPHATAPIPNGTA